jgi:hypothetical protein
MGSRSSIRRGCSRAAPRVCRWTRWSFKSHPGRIRSDRHRRACGMPRTCVFCGASPTSNEHVWPVWARRRFAPKGPSDCQPRPATVGRPRHQPPVARPGLLAAGQGRLPGMQQRLDVSPGVQNPIDPRADDRWPWAAARTDGPASARLRVGRQDGPPARPGAFLRPPCLPGLGVADGPEGVVVTAIGDQRSRVAVICVQSPPSSSEPPLLVPPPSPPSRLTGHPRGQHSTMSRTWPHTHPTNSAG